MANYAVSMVRVGGYTLGGCAGALLMIGAIVGEPATVLVAVGILVVAVAALLIVRRLERAAAMDRVRAAAIVYHGGPADGLYRMCMELDTNGRPADERTTISKAGGAVPTIHRYRLAGRDGTAVAAWRYEYDGQVTTP